MSIFTNRSMQITKEATKAFGSATEAERFLNTPQPAYLGSISTTPLSLAESSYKGFNTVRSMMRQLSSHDI